MKLAIETDGLTKHFGRVRAVNDLSLEVPIGSIYGFLGPNGSGKTTTLRILAGLSRPTAGTASVYGVPVTPAGRHRRCLGFLAQEPKFYRWMTGRQVLQYVGRFFDNVDDKYIDHLLRQAGIADAADRKTKTYSGGMRQRLGIAQALVGRPKLLMLDEPVSSLDPIGRNEVLSMMNALKGETTIFFSTHILDDVQRCSDYVAILHKGQLVRAERTSELLASFTKGSMQVVLAGPTEGVEKELRGIEGVSDITRSKHKGDEWMFDLAVEDNRARDIQRAVTRLAADRGWAVIVCDEARVNLESVFLKLIGSDEKKSSKDN